MKEKLTAQIEALETIKAQAIKEQDYVKAGDIRDEVHVLKKQLEELE